MNHRILFPVVVVAVLALSACGGGAPASPSQAAEKAASNQPSEKAAGKQSSVTPGSAEATVTIGDHVYEFSSDPALTWGKVLPASCLDLFGTLEIRLWLVAIDGQTAEELDGDLRLQVSDPVSESTNDVSIKIKPTGVEYVAGVSLNIVDVKDQPITLTRDGFTISGSQEVYNKVYDAPEPKVVTAQIDARCVDF